MSTPRPVDIILHRATRVLEVAFDDDTRFSLAAEYLRVNSPSAEVQGHGPGQKVLVSGKRDVAITGIEPIGHYAVLLRFSDGHASGIFTWGNLHRLGQDQERSWAEYLAALETAGLSRDAARSPFQPDGTRAAGK